MRILIISNSEWDDNNSFGNTFSNFFAETTDIEFANIYCRTGVPHTNQCRRFLRIDDIQLIKHVFKRKYNPVCRVDNVVRETPATTRANKSYAFAKRKRWAVFFLARELLWLISNYKNKEFVITMNKKQTWIENVESLLESLLNICRENNLKE